MSGYSREELLALPLRDLEAFKSGPEIAAHIEKITTQGRDRFESRHRRKDGTLFDVEISVCFHADTDHFYCFIRDITITRKAQREEALSHRHLELLLELNDMADRPTREIDRFALAAAIELSESAFGFLAYLEGEGNSPSPSVSWTKIVGADGGPGPQLNFIEDATCPPLDHPLFHPLLVNDLVNAYESYPTWPMPMSIPDKRFILVPVVKGNRLKLLVGVADSTECYTNANALHLQLLAESLWRLSQREKDSAALLARERTYREILEKAPSAIIIHQSDAPTKIVDVNLAMCKMFGYSREEALQLEIADLSYGMSQDGPATLALIRSHIQMTLVSGHNRFEWCAKHKDGSPLWIEVELHQTLIMDEPLILASLYDLTNRKFAEKTLLDSLHALKAINETLKHSKNTLEQRVVERTAELNMRMAQLTSLAEQMTRVEELERCRIAQVLHDELQQVLVGARMSLGALSVTTKRRPSTQRKISEIEELLTDALKTIHLLTTELSPPIDYHFGLESTFRWLGRWFESTYGLIVEVDLEDEVDVAVETKITLYQAVRELLFNTVKHANVPKASLSLHRLEEELFAITVRDDGIGFDPVQVQNNASLTKGIGLYRLQKRLDLLGARLEIESAPSHGSCFTIIMPLVRQNAGPPMASL